MERAEELFERIAREGEAAIDELIRDRASEELFLDFITSKDSGNGSKLDPSDRNNLANAISGFANSEGGVIVWGVYCKEGADNADVARAKKPITNPTRFRSWIERAISGCTVPVHSGVRNEVIQRTISNEGFVITYVPKSNCTPHQTVESKKYLIRAGSSFVPTPHQVLAGMFGRRPQPNVYLMFGVNEPRLECGKICAELGFTIRNDGPGIARDLFFSLMIKSIPGPNTELASQPTDLTRWIGLQSYDCHTSLITNPEIRLAPESQVQPMRLFLKLAPPFEDDIAMEGIVGSAESVPFKFHFCTPPNELEKVYSRFLKTELTVEEKAKFLGMVFSMKD